MHREGDEVKKTVKRAFRAIAYLLIMTMLPWGTSLTASAVSLSDEDITGYADAICSCVLQSEQIKNIQAFLNGKAAENAAGMYDWFVFALMQSGTNHDFSSYAGALAEKAQADTKANAAEKEKYALILSAFDGNDEYINDVLDTCPDGLGIMSLIYALHITNNGYASSVFPAEKLISKILSLQNADGGWGLSENASMPDITAMALQALAPYYKKNDAVTKAVDNALTSLSAAQTENGGYVAYGYENAESTAQVIIALCSLGIAVDDERFVRNGAGLYDSLLSYSLPDGSFEHVKGKGTNFKATEQALLAFTAMQRAKNGKTLYVVDMHTAETKKDFPFSVLCFAAAVLCLIPAVLLTKKKKKSANIFIVLSALAAIAGLILCLDIQKPEDYYTASDPADSGNTVTVTMSVNCDTIKEHAAEKDYIPADGVILGKTEFTLAEGSTVYDCLVTAAKKYNIQTENDSATAASAYISGINYIYEFDFGALSGWCYRVNGEDADVGCGEYKVSDGDDIEWLYTCSLGEDLP